ncbi:MAG: response regulator, partial [bacterium]
NTKSIIKLKQRTKIPGGSETILLVEDEEEVRTLTARMLKKQGYTVMQAREGKSALMMAEKFIGSIDMLVTDVIMPFMNGRDLAERLKAKRSNMKVLFISGHTDSMITHFGIDESRVAFLQKPFTIETISYKIRNVFDN